MTFLRERHFTVCNFHFKLFSPYFFFKTLNYITNLLSPNVIFVQPSVKSTLRFEFTCNFVCESKNIKGDENRNCDYLDFYLDQNCFWHRQTFIIPLSLLTSLKQNCDQNFSFLIIVFTVIQYLDYKVSTLTCQPQSCSGFSCFSCLVFHWGMTDWKKKKKVILTTIIMNHVVNKCQKMFKAFHMFRYFVQPTAEKRKRSKEVCIILQKKRSHLTKQLLITQQNTEHILLLQSQMVWFLCKLNIEKTKTKKFRDPLNRE